MKTIGRVVVGVALGVTGALAAPVPPARGVADAIRSVFISAIDRKGGFVTDLTAADLVVKENGQAREVIGLAPATEVCHVAVLVDDGGEGSMQSAVTELLNAAAGRAVFSISLLNPQSIRLNDYTSDHDVLQNSVFRLVQRGRLQRDTTQLSDAVAWAARDMEKRRVSRPVVVILTNAGDSADPEIAREILNDLRISRASLHVVHVVGVDFSAVLSDGPKQSGGSTTVSSSRKGFADATAAIAKTLEHQYKLTYRLPDGVKPSDRLQVTTTRPTLKVVAPTRISDK